MSKFTITRRYPNYFSGFEETVHTVDNLKELEEIDWVANAINYKNHHTLAISTKEPDKWNPDKEVVHHLMALTNYDEKYGGCKRWWVIGKIVGEPVSELGLTEWTDLKGNHLDGCPQKAWQHDDCMCGFKS